MKIPEEWLKDNCQINDWDRLHENLKDSLFTSNVVKYYMKEYAEYIVQQRLSASPSGHSAEPNVR